MEKNDKKERQQHNHCKERQQAITSMLRSSQTFLTALFLLLRSSILLLFSAITTIILFLDLFWLVSCVIILRGQKEPVSNWKMSENPGIWNSGDYSFLILKRFIKLKKMKKRRHSSNPTEISFCCAKTMFSPSVLYFLFISGEEKEHEKKHII